MNNDYDYRMEIFLDPDAAENLIDAVKQKLQNLGYGTGEPLKHQIEFFQREHGQAVTGNIDDASNPLSQCHDECKPPLRVIDHGRS